MNQTAGSHSRIRDFLKGVTSFSLIDSGIALASNGGIVESNKSGSYIKGIVRDGEETHTVTLDILTASDIDAQCSCCSDEDMTEFWCHHAVAVLWSACDLGFLDAASGFESSESTIRMNMSSPSEIAHVIDDLNHIEYTSQAAVSYHPKVSVHLDCSSDRLGVQVQFDGEIQEPAFFDLGKRASSRALDTILLKVLDDEGSWDDLRKLWFVNSSKGIDVVLGIIQEYEKIVLVDDPKKKVRFSKELLEGQLIVKWLESSADISMKWILPNGEIVDRSGELIGTGPYWTVVDACMYRLSAAASKISSIFPYTRSINIPRQQVGPILEVIGSGVFNSNLIHIEHPELQPESEVKDPQPKLSMAMRDTRAEHFVSSEKLELDAILDFSYPSPPKNKNVVFLPNREREREFVDFLKSIGFESTSEKGKYTIAGDDALDLIHGTSAQFQKPWLVTGLDIIKDKIKFADLTLQVSVTSNASADAKKGASHWFDCHIALTQNKSNIPISTLFKPSRTQAERWIKLDSGAYARVPGGSLHQLKTTLGMIDPGFKLSNTIKTKLGTGQAVNLGRLEDSSVVLNLDNKLKDLQRKLIEFKEIDTLKAKKEFQGKLRSYQEEGLSWINFLDDYELGGILADEMGLGKTVQTLAFLQHLRDKRKSSKKKLPSLIVAPTSVITNWCYEIKRFVPDMSFLLLHGPQRKLFFKDIPKADIVITSYALLRLDRSELEKYEFEYFIIDEAQNIKNPSAAITKAAKAIPSKRRLALTGTPTENRPLELWSIIDFCMPGYLGSEEFFRTHIEKPILEGASPQQTVRFLNAKTRPFLLRRTKAEVEKDLPPKMESVVHVEMTASQAQLYGQVLEEVRPKVLDAIEKKGVGGASVSILAALLRLRQICNHPNSIEALKGIAGFESGKFNLLKDLVTDAIENGRKILVFSQFREMLAIMKRWLEEEKVNHLYLDGTTKNRQELIDSFNNDESIRLFLISLKAGGTGLNLTAADTVIIYDPWWNPAVESQAVDRAHRIGQTKAVSVYRLVTEESVEQKIMSLKSKKSKVVDALINENGLSTIKLSKTDIESLFAPMKPAGEE